MHAYVVLLFYENLSFSYTHDKCVDVFKGTMATKKTLYIFLLFVPTGRPASSSPSSMNCPRGVRLFFWSRRSASAGCPSSSCPAATPTPRPLGWIGRTWVRTYTRPATSRRSQSCITTTASPRSCELWEGFTPSNPTKQQLKCRFHICFHGLFAFIVTSVNYLK